MFTTAQHWKFFAEFCQGELASGGPDPQLKMVAEMIRGQPLHEKVWRAGCYIAVYNVPFGEAIWRGLSWRKVSANPELVLPWLQEHWPKITTRVERRSVRRPEWMNAFLLGYISFVHKYSVLQRECLYHEPEQAYLVAWDRALEVPRLGRYVALKLLELLSKLPTKERLCLRAPDIRPKGGWSPRSTLATLFEEPRAAADDNKPATLALVNELCVNTLAILKKNFGVELDLFQLQVMLCEYRESWEGERQYPGRSLDSELKYAAKAEAQWGVKSKIWAARTTLFPAKHLGELSGWDGPREACAQALSHHHYTWSDLTYNFRGTVDFSRPVKWGEKPHPPALVSASVPRAQRGQRVTVWQVIPGKVVQSGRWLSLTQEQCAVLIKEQGITGIANFWKEDPRLKELVGWYRFWPTSDGKTIPPTVGRMVSEMAKFVREGGCLMTMCYGGKNRSGMASALVVKALTGCSGAEAVQVVKQARKGALTNQHFVTYIAGERSLGTLF